MYAPDGTPLYPGEPPAPAPMSPREPGPPPSGIGTVRGAQSGRAAAQPAGYTGAGAGGAVAVNRTAVRTNQERTP